MYDMGHCGLFCTVYNMKTKHRARKKRLAARQCSGGGGGGGLLHPRQHAGQVKQVLVNYTSGALIVFG